MRFKLYKRVLTCLLSQSSVVRSFYDIQIYIKILIDQIWHKIQQKLSLSTVFLLT